MAGIHDRLSGAAGATDKLSVNLFHAAYVMRALGEHNDVQILILFNASVENSLFGTELTDLTNIGAAMDLEVGTTAKVIYAERIRAVGIEIEEASLSDADMRTILGIV